MGRERVGKTISGISQFHSRGRAWLRPHLPQLQTPKYSPAPLAGLRCRPLRARGKVGGEIERVQAGIKLAGSISQGD